MYFELDVGICSLNDLKGGAGLATVNGIRGRPHAKLVFEHAPSELRGKDFYAGKLFPMYATQEYHTALHKALKAAYSVQILSEAVPGIDLWFAEDDAARIALFQKRSSMALRNMQGSQHYALFGRLSLDGSQLAEWMVTDPLPLAQAVPDEYGR